MGEIIFSSHPFFFIGKCKALFGFFFFFHYLLLLTQFSSLITDHSKISQFLITLLGGLFGWNISVGFSIQTLTFMSLIGSHKNQLQIRCTERSPSLPALSLSLSLSPLHALSTTKHYPQLQKPKMKHKYQNLSAQKPSIINRSELWLENTSVPFSIWT